MHVKISVEAGAKKERVVAHADGSYTIAVREPAERNQANRRVLAIIGKDPRIAGKRIQIVSGHHAPKKIIHISN